ncbi:hypothetical protein RhiJN_14989 [Ceratobasidium sp. AG-Ba]|nr:hypothetical protein RhiJN_00007 [Ceratobasidium sp. AG-Ba]QRV86971.1 hypothetical protein RhiJN_14989 [Ceratobasidium sp. AG-Ba]
MSSLPPRPHAHEAQSIPRHMNRLAKRDPQLYPLAAIVVATLGVAGYFFTSNPTGADKGHVQPNMPSTLKQTVDNYSSEGLPSISRGDKAPQSK